MAISGFTNATFDGIVEGATIIPLDERADELHSAEEILAKEIPGMSLWYRTGEYAYRPEAYGGWVSDPGHGLFTKRSFLPDSVNAAHPAAAEVVTTEAPTPEASAAVNTSVDTTVEADAQTPVATNAPNATTATSSDDSEGDGDGNPLVWIIGAVAVAAIGVLLLARRRRRSGEGDDD